MRAVGPAISCVAMVSTDMRMAISTAASGSKAKWTAKARKHGQMALTIWVITLKDRRMALARTYGPMDRAFTASGTRMKLTALAWSNGKMGATISVSGIVETCMALGSMFGRTRNSMRASIIMTKNMATASTSGRMGVDTWASGKKESSTVSLNIKPSKDRPQVTPKSP